MAAYGSGYYGAWNYSYGVSLGQFELTSASTATVAGFLIVSGGVGISDSSTVAIDATRVAFATATISDATEISISSNVVVNQGVTITSSSSIVFDAKRISLSSIGYVCGSTITINARLKWEQLSDTAETWIAVSDTSESWTPIADTSKTWQQAA